MTLKFVKLLLLFILSLLLMVFVYYFFILKDSHKSLVKDLSGQCKTSPNDTFDYGLKYNFGKYKNICLNSCTTRPLITNVIPAEEGQKQGYYSIKNLLHENSFWSVDIPFEQIDKTQIVFENFTWKINHVAFKFGLKGPVVLRSQNSNEVQTLSGTSIVVSPEAALPDSFKYNLKDGLFGNYSLIFRAYSEEQYLKMAVDLKHKVKIFNTKLNSKQTRALAHLTLLKSSENHTRYQLVFNNCATSTIQLALEIKGSDQV